MIEDDIRQLDAEARERVLDGLEAAVWARLAEREEDRARSVRLLTLQAVVLGFVFGASAFAGHYYAARSERTTELTLLSASAPLTASTLLGDTP